MVRTSLLAAAAGLGGLGVALALLLARRWERPAGGPRAWLRAGLARATSPLSIEFVVFVTAMVLASRHFLPLQSIQVELWAGAALALLADGASTAWLGRVDPAAAEGAPWLESDSGDPVRILMARVALFAGVGAAVLFVHAVERFHDAAVVFGTVLYVPVILGAGAVAATLINLRAIAGGARPQERRSS
jgi:hypothetical protein